MGSVGEDVASVCDNGICARPRLPTPRVPPPTLAQPTANDESGGIARTTLICTSTHSPLERPLGAWKFPNRESAAAYVASVCAAHRHLHDTPSDCVAGSSGHDAHNQAVETAICQDSTDVCTTQQLSTSQPQVLTPQRRLPLPASPLDLPDRVPPNAEVPPTDRNMSDTAMLPRSAVPICLQLTGLRRPRTRYDRDTSVPVFESDHESTESVSDYSHSPSSVRTTGQRSV